MEISNRKLFSRGMVAIGFAVAFSGVPGDIFAADQPETAAAVATAGTGDNELSAQEKALRRKNFWLSARCDKRRQRSALPPIAS